MNKSNAQHAILFEAISLILALDFSKDLLNSSVSSLGRFLSVKVGSNSVGVLIRPWQCKHPVLNAGTGHKWTLISTCCVLACLQEPNIRYLALENLTRLALVPEVLESIREHQVCAAVHHCLLDQVRHKCRPRVTLFHVTLVMPALANGYSISRPGGVRDKPDCHAVCVNALALTCRPPSLPT